jgi:superoxide dismutase
MKKDGRTVYIAKSFDHLRGLTGLSDAQVTEHAFMRDYKASERAKYVDAFFKNTDWTAVDQRLLETGAVRAA